MVHAYREAIRCEVLRTEIFAGRRKPLIFGEPPHWMAWLLESLRLMVEYFIRMVLDTHQPKMVIMRMRQLLL